MKSNDLGFIPTGFGNYVLARGGFKISYNPCADGGPFGRVFAGDGNGEETALCVNGKFFILNGNFCKAYADAADLPACLEIFKANQSLRSSWSNSLDEISGAA